MQLSYLPMVDGTGQCRITDSFDSSMGCDQETNMIGFYRLNLNIFGDLRASLFLGWSLLEPFTHTVARISAKSMSIPRRAQAKFAVTLTTYRRLNCNEFIDAGGGYGLVMASHC